MSHRRAITTLSLLAAALGAIAAGIGAFSRGGPGPYAYESVRGREVALHGIGVYRDMSAEVAPQGIAQDYVTLVLAVPLLLAALAGARRGSLRGTLGLAGVLAYFVVTYLFYLMMAMYNALFLIYVLLLSASSFAFALTLSELTPRLLAESVGRSLPARPIGGFLVFTAVAIALLWLSVVVPPLLDGTVIPTQVEHYTTLVVQGLDLALLLPLSFVAGLSLLRGRPAGSLLGPVYLVFLALLMTALTAKVVAMRALGYNVVPAIFIIPTFNVAAVALATWLLVSLPDPARKRASA